MGKLETLTRKQSKNARMTTAIAMVVNCAVSDLGFKAIGSSENDTIKIVDGSDKVIFILAIIQTPLEFTLFIANHLTAKQEYNPKSVEDVDGNDNYLQKTITTLDMYLQKEQITNQIRDWFQCLMHQQNDKKLALNKRIVEHIQNLFVTSHPYVSFSINSVYPEIMVGVNGCYGVAVFGIRQNGACFILRDVESEKTFTVNFVDTLIGDQKDEHLKKWLMDYIFGPEIQ
jgi:hypothetical protein